MATRPPRLRQPHTSFHVTSRGTNRWNIFLDDADRYRFMFLLAAICKKYDITAHAYCLMGNHFHLVLYCPQPVLSQAMRDLKSRYATYVNTRHNFTGPVFEGPFVEVPILDDEHLMTEIRYAHRNPCDLDPNACLASYLWSSHGIYLGLRPQPHFMSIQIAQALFGPNYREFVEAPRDSDKVQNRVRPFVHSPGECTLVANVDWSLAGILREVATVAGCELSEVSPLKRNGLIGIAINLALGAAGYTAAEVADPFGYKSTSAVHMAGRRGRARLASDPELAAIYEAVLKRRQRAA